MSRSNKHIVLEVLKRAFRDHDPSVVEQYFGANYTQHNPHIPDGPSAIAKMIPTLTALRYAPGMAVAEGDLVMVHFAVGHAENIDRNHRFRSGRTLGRAAGRSRGGGHGEWPRHVHRV